METLRRAMGLLSGAWSWVRQVSGDAAYENYLRQAIRGGQNEVLSGASAVAAPLSRAEFYLDSLRRRYSTVSRCC
ncbi:MAG TPA: hypothetical protein VNV41_07930 [Candidatus Acidoferrales bacterium]|jgi:hypothetical protein|nr:hypothetical protein [Candidatus Acidoferrales bacterium]